ncbi:hypothetical protein [Endozoicomonas ascidiicola]|uniref:hypothetical protein n=1 Tax=Endozoicomonas ascidiicola TaxID=1698521 RepID=UPI000836DD03|nr:hypothetical protein [Endozoicomonas ascidiicola]
MEFTESGLSFRFEDDRCYRIEEAQGAIDVGDGIKKAEFLYIDAGNNLWVLEAKTTIANEHKSKEEFESELQAIYEKLYNSLQLTVLGLTGRHQAINEELPAEFKSTDWSGLTIQLVLVIPGVPPMFLPDLTDKLRKKFSPWFLKAWNIKEANIQVLNRDFAQRKALCQ